MQFIKRVVLDNFEKQIRASKNKEDFILEIGHMDHLIRFISLIDDDTNVSTEALKDMKYHLKTNKLFHDGKAICKVKFNFNKESDKYYIGFMFYPKVDISTQFEKQWTFSWTSLDKDIHCLAC